jgi:hypothetical protein
MQDLSRFEELGIRHERDDGTWGEYEARDDHDVATHDDERKWGGRRRFVCVCGDEIEISPPANRSATPS